MAKKDTGKEGPFLANSKGNLRFTGTIPDYGRVTNGVTPVESNRTQLKPFWQETWGTPRGNVKNVGR